jgi:hypothetical protein
MGPMFDPENFVAQCDAAVLAGGRAANILTVISLTVLVTMQTGSQSEEAPDERVWRLMSLRTSKTGAKLGARSCQSSFCRAHGASWTSDPAGALDIEARLLRGTRRVLVGVLGVNTTTTTRGWRGSQMVGATWKPCLFPSTARSPCPQRDQLPPEMADRPRCAGHNNCEHSVVNRTGRQLTTSYASASRR